MPDWDWAMGIAGLFLVLVAVVATIGLHRRLAMQSRETDAHLRRLERQLELLRQSISGLTAGAVGMDRRLFALEARERLLTERQETYENQQNDDRPYGHAIRLVQQGAGIGRLVDELDLSESEADLIVRLHGHRDTA